MSSREQKRTSFDSELIWAIKNAPKDIPRLLEAGGNPNTMDKGRPLCERLAGSKFRKLASHDERMSAWKALLSCDDLDKNHLHKIMPELIFGIRDRVSREEDYEEISFLLDSGIPCSELDFFRTAQAGGTFHLKAMLEHGLSPNSKGEPGMWGGETALITTARSGNTEAGKFLIKMGADVNAQGNAEIYDTRNVENQKNSEPGWTALHWAVRRNDVTLIHALLDAGADASIRDLNGLRAGDLATYMNTPLMLSWHIADMFADNIAKKEANALKDKFSLPGNRHAAGI